MSSISARTILWYVVFFGFAVNYMIRVNINIAIVAMVVSPSKVNNEKSACHLNDVDVNNNDTTSELLLNDSKPLLRYEDDHRFVWDEHLVNVVLGSFYWLHWLSQIPGGFLSRRFGTKLVFGLANFISSLLTFLIPVCAYWDYKAVVFVRVLQGLITGLAWPSMHHMTAQWIPPNERSKFVSAYLGSSVGVALTFPLCGLLLKYLDWKWVFYTTACLGVVWYIIWYCLVYDSPGQHPTIDPSERKYIETSLGKSFKHQTHMEVPWKEMLTSMPVWSVILVQWSGNWALFTLITQAPTYLRHIIGLDYAKTGFYSGIPHLVRALFSLGFATFADYLLAKQILCRTNVRKLATFTNNIVSGVIIIGLAYVGCNENLAILLLILGTAAHGAVSSGALACIVDLSPNFAGLLQGMVGTLGAMTGFFSAYVVGVLTDQNQTVEQWKKVYLLTSALLISTGLVYQIIGRAELQPWNSPKKQYIDAQDPLEETQLNFMPPNKTI